MPAILALAVLLCTTAAPGTLRAADKWLRLSSENFDMFSCSSERESTDMLVQLEQFRATFFKVFQTKSLYVQRPLIFVFDNERQYKPYMPLTKEGKTKDIGGLHMPSPLVSRFSVLNKHADDGLSTLYHEYTHALLKAGYGSGIPLWFNEGTAVALSTFNVFDDDVTLGKKHMNYLGLMRNTPLIPAETFLSVDYNSPYYNEEYKIGIFYGQSWLLMHRLLCSPKDAAPPGLTLSNLHKYLRLSADPATPKDDALRQSFGLDYKGLDDALRNYLRSNFTTLRRNVVLAKPIRDKITCRPVTEAERDLELAALQFRSRFRQIETAAAPPQFLQAAEQRPQDPRPCELLAEWAYFTGNRAQAAEYCRKAIDLGSTNPEVYIYYLRELLWGSPQEYVLRADLCADYRAKVDRAMELAPDNMAAIEMLAWIEANSEEPRASMLNKIYEALPNMRDERERTLYSVAVLLWRHKDYEKAEAALNSLLNIPGLSAAMKSSVQTLLRRIAQETGKAPPKSSAPSKAKAKGKGKAK